MVSWSSVQSETRNFGSATGNFNAFLQLNGQILYGWLSWTLDRMCEWSSALVGIYPSSSECTAVSVKLYSLVCKMLCITHISGVYYRYLEMGNFCPIICHQIGCIHLSHCYHIFPCLRCLLHHILLLIAYTSRENREFVFIIIGQFLMSSNGRIRFGLKIVFVSSTLHHLIIIIVQTYLKSLNIKNACQIYFVESVR